MPRPYDVLVIEPEVEDRMAESVRLDKTLRGLGVPVDVIVLDAATARSPEHREVVERMLAKGRADLAAIELCGQRPAKAPGKIVE